MICEVRRPVAKFGLDIWFYDQPGAGPGYLWIPGRTSADMESKSYDPRSIEATPCLHLTHEMVDALVEAVSDYTPPNRAMANHLQDALRVRDRLLDTFVKPQVAYHIENVEQPRG